MAHLELVCEDDHKFVSPSVFLHEVGRMFVAFSEWSGPDTATVQQGLRKACELHFVTTSLPALLASNNATLSTGFSLGKVCLE